MYKSFVQTVKCSFFNKLIVYQSFYGALLMFSYFLLQKSCMLLCQKIYLQFCLTQIVHSNGETFFPLRKNCSSKFLRCTAHILLLFFLSFSNESHVFRHMFQVACLERVSSSQKNVIFWLCLLYEDGIVEAYIPGSI